MKCAAIGGARFVTPLGSGRENALRHHLRDHPGGRPAASARRDRKAVRVSASYFDWYDILNVKESASPQDIRSSYRHLQKRCHPDVSGDLLGHDMGILLNQAYTTLSDPRTRATFDGERELHNLGKGFTGEPLSAWAGPEDEHKAHFVDENACTGCLQCALVARGTFSIDIKSGKARVTTQWGDTPEDIAQAAEMCPVSCIHKVARSQVPYLEFVMRLPGPTTGRVAEDPFVQAERLERRGWAREARVRRGSPRTSMDEAAEQIMYRHVGGSQARWREESKKGQVPARPETMALVPLSTFQHGRSVARLLHAEIGALPEHMDYLLRAAKDRAQGRAGPGRWRAGGGAGEEEWTPEDTFWEPEEVRTCAVPHVTNAEAAAALSARAAARQHRDARMAAAREAEGALVVGGAAHMALVAAAMAAIGWMMVQGGGGVSYAEGAGPAERAQAAQAARETCYKRGGGLCRFSL